LKATLQHNQQRIAAKIAAAAKTMGRNPNEFTVVAITKYVDASSALELASLGQLDLGENRHDKLEAKAAAFRAAKIKVRWHFVGHLQRNKARRVAKIAHVIHSVDTPRLIDTLDRAAAEENRRLKIFLEVRLTEDAGKHGFTPEDLYKGIEVLRTARNIDPLGLMCMSGTNSDSEASAKTFAQLKALAAELQSDPHMSSIFTGGKVLTSMGMSGDFEEAILEGADYLRIGSSFFTGLMSEPKSEASA
jgi:pyridoxal phosphate enzyme (YggS family)